MQILFIILLAIASAETPRGCQDRLDQTLAWRLTRDEMPSIFAREKSRVQVRRATPEEYEELLFKKLEEEVNEFSVTPTVEEAADVKEVLLALRKHFQMSLEDEEELARPFQKLLSATELDEEEVERARAIKHAKKGGFAKGFVIRASPVRRAARR